MAKKSVKAPKGKSNPIYDLVIRATGPTMTHGSLVENTATKLILSVRRYRSHKRELRVFNKKDLIGWFIDNENVCSVISNSSYLIDDRFSGIVSEEDGVVTVTSDTGVYYLNEVDDNYISLTADDEDGEEPKAAKKSKVKEEKADKSSKKKKKAPVEDDEDDDLD